MLAGQQQRRGQGRRTQKQELRLLLLLVQSGCWQQQALVLAASRQR